MLVGQLNYATLVIPIAKHFLGQIHCLINRILKKSSVINLPLVVINDLIL